MNKLLFKRYPYLNRLIKKITSNNTPNNTTFIYYNTIQVNIQSGTSDYMDVTIRNVKTNDEIASFTFDYLTMEINILFADTNDIAMDIMHSFRQVYPYGRIIFNLNKSDEIFTEENYQEITAKGFKCNLINLYCNITIQLCRNIYQ